MNTNQAVDAVGAETPGIRWALAMLFLQVAEVLGLSEVIFSDRPQNGLPHQFGMIEIYYTAVIVTVLLQATGILLARQRRYRLGGALQIAASSLHLFKVEGLIGIIGGLRAWKYQGPAPDRLQSAPLEQAVPSEP